MSKTLFDQARRYLAGGVDSPVRAFNAVGLPPVFVRYAKGKYLFSETGKRYVDFCLSWGPLILGHAHPVVTKAVMQAVREGTSFGAPTRRETALAKLICSAFPAIDRLRFVSSGTEAVMSAIRLARGYTGKSMILKFDGCYHGHSDALLVNAGSGVAGLAHASSAGVPDEVVAHTLSLPYNDCSAAAKAIRKHANKLAAVIVEPVAGNMGVVPPAPGFLETLREVTQQHGVLLIFDEVITGFRLCFGGAQHVYGIAPDLTTLGKIIGGGMPVGAFGGRRDIMRRLAPEGDVYQAGTLSGNPVAMAAGLATLEYLRDHREVYAAMGHRVNEFAEQWRARSALTINHVGSMFTIFHTAQPVSCYADAMRQDKGSFRRFYRRQLRRGNYLPPSPYEAAFVSVKHTGRDLAALLP